MPTRPCRVEIRTRSLENNYRYLACLAGSAAELLAIVKADAYGHSLALCAPAAVRAGARWLGVTSVEEGVAARALCPEPEILVIGGVFPGQGAAVVEHRLTTVVWDPWQLDELEAVARKAGAPPGSLPVHLEIDTGMSRQGIGPDGFAAILSRFSTGSPLSLQGVMTHLFAADESDGRVTAEQLERLDAALQRIESAGLHAEWLNVGNPGLALYGLAPEFEPEEPAPVAAARAHLQPVLSWKTAVVSLRDIPAGAVVGYNGTFVATEPMHLALIACGYGDGLGRSLGNRFSLLVRGQRAPLVGRVSMDQAVLDVTGIAAVEVGDEVVIVGSQLGETMSAFDLAGATGTVPWEIFTRITSRAERVEV